MIIAASKSTTPASVASHLKPIVQMQKAVVREIAGSGVLMGYPVDYPEEHCAFPGAVSNMKEIVTTPIVAIDPEESIVETYRTRYKILSLDTSHELKEYLVHNKKVLGV